MRSYIVYTEVPDLTGGKAQYYLTPDGGKSANIKDAKRWDVKTWLEFVITILQLLIKIFGTNLKYKRL